MTIDTLTESRAKRLRPRQWNRRAAETRYPVDANWPDPLSRAHRDERRRRRPPLEAVVCESCGVELAMVRRGGSAWCPACRVWSGGSAERGMAG